jgi:hypothetical protein
VLKKIIRYITHWEDWYWLIKYIPIAPVWAWQWIRCRSIWFFSPSNPKLKFGGFIGETKREMYALLPAGTYPNSIFIAPSMSFQEVEAEFQKKGLAYPIAVKPDVGLMGFMFRKVDNAEQLRQYHEIMPCDYVAQDLVTLPVEVSVFYYRYPNEEKGHITGFIRKENLEVIGDGKSTLWELIQRYEQVTFFQEEMRAKHESHLHEIIPAGEHYVLSYALYLSRGSRLVEIAEEKDERLLKVFDELSHAGQFYFGRYDIRCQSIEDLKQGRNYSILEYNGSGAEPHHVYGGGYSLYRACYVLAQHWNILGKIARQSRKKGVPYWPFWDGVRISNQARKHYDRLKQLDAGFEFKTRQQEYQAKPETPLLTCPQTAA